MRVTLYDDFFVVVGGASILSTMIALKSNVIIICVRTVGSCQDISGKIPIRPDRKELKMEKSETKKLEVRVTAAQLEKLDALAAKANMDRSQFVRTVCLQGDRLVVLTEFPEIIRMLSEIDGKLSSAIVNGYLSESLMQETDKLLEQIVAYLMRMDKQLDELNKEAGT